MPEHAGGSFARRLDQLFKTVRPRGRGEFSYREVAAGVAERTGTVISPSYIWQLRAGVKDNPTKRHIEALASFFGVPPAFFFDAAENERVEAELETLAVLRDSGVTAIALRANGLSAESLRLVADLIERTRSLEGLDGDVAPVGR